MEFIDLKAEYAAMRESVNARIQRVLDHGQYIMGPEVGELEARLAEFTGARHCISVSSGTEALLISLMALDIGPGDEVITTPFTFVATAETIVLAGASPVFVDIDPVTFNIDPALIERAITPRTKAVLPVSLYGQPADMEEINAIAKRHSIAVIEDAAQSFGAMYKGRQSGNLSDLGCTSFFPSKPLGCYGDGGAIFTNDDARAQACREIRVHGQSRRYYHSRIGVGGRMDTIQCAVVLAKLEKFQWAIEQRHALGRRYGDMLGDCEGVLGLPHVKPDRTSVHAQYTIRVARREDVQTELNALGVPTAVHYPVPLHRQPAYVQFFSEGGLPHAEKAAAEVMSLPFHPYMNLADTKQVVDGVGRAIHQTGLISS